MQFASETLRARKALALNLTTSTPAKLPSLLDKFHFLYLILPQLFLFLPLKIIYSHLLNRRNSKIIKEVGRGVLADFMVRVSNYVMENGSAREVRMIVNRDFSYDFITGGFSDWVEKIEWNGLTGRILAPPGTKREEDDVVLYFIHGGGFIIDSGGSACAYWHELLKEMNLKRKIQFSIFLLDYELAPESFYPSQLIETLAGYSYLVNHLNIKPSRICLSGDSAGGNLATCFLLHLARPNPVIKVPVVFGPTPVAPGSVALVSPHNNLFTTAPSTLENSDFDVLGVGKGGFGNFAALDYIGVQCDKNPGKAPNHVPAWNPLYLLPGQSPYPRSVKITISEKLYVEDGVGLELASSPYLNPILAEDGWLEEAFGGELRVLVTYGGKEILRDSILAFITRLEKVGVEVTHLTRSFGMHDWIFFDFTIPGLWKSSLAKGKEGNKNFGVVGLADFLQETELLERKVFWESKKVT